MIRVTDGLVEESMVDRILVLQTTCVDSAEAKRMGQALVAAKLAGCVQVQGPIESIYRWEGKVEVSSEWVLSIKTLPRFSDRIEEFVNREHSYDTPQIVAYEVQSSRAYAAWLSDQVA